MSIPWNTHEIMKHETHMDADGRAVPLLRLPTFKNTQVCMSEQTRNLNPIILQKKVF